MDKNLPSALPSLELAFAPERAALTAQLENQMSAAQTVGAARSALDRAGVAFARANSDPKIQKAGLWLLEMVKSGAGVLDRATQTEITYVETAPPKSFSGIARPTIFYGAAGAIAVIGLLNGAALAVISAAVLAGLHTLEPMRFKTLKSKLPFWPKPKGIEDQSGRQFKAEAQLVTDAHGFVGQLTDALKTADHILLRLSEPEADGHWSDEGRLTGLLQNLLEAGTANDSGFAMELINKELPSLLASSGIEAVSYSKKTAKMFDNLPAIGDGPKAEMAAPALVAKDGRILRRGTVWMRG